MRRGGAVRGQQCDHSWTASLHGQFKIRREFLDVCLPKVRRAREAISASGLDVWVQVDGGVSAETIERCAVAGADVFVAGSAVYGAEDASKQIAALRALAEGAHAPYPGV